MRTKIETVLYRRKREGKTNYKKRLAVLKSGKPRLVVRPSVKSITMQVIKYLPKGDIVVAAVNSRALAKMGWKASLCNTPAAYLTGMLIAKKAQEKKVTECVLDIGLVPSIRGSKVFAALKGAADNGLKIPLSEEIMPKEDRIKGAHIEAYAKKLAKESKEKYEKQFSGYLKAGIRPEDLPKMFDDIKNRIKGK